ncbi:NAD(P)/FAD-dependent oxidoreductase [Hydrogenophaga sp. A37]|uniref:NAD(P)/FAD-dependent oxidoreductase n=1 Tax=Hydrogenophaga sp. A37 TaxID=1945864 RepID=UPI0009868B52|nr:FAD-dependent oxidoreductase [Hydrogenophaga sp. A37]OOG84349.1 pyridine nucleotide-disulfide oxidoreductase [Hydrogenophaga sp. A37]
MRTPHAVILGAGHAAAQLATSLRQQGWQGDITLVGEEPVLPYQRPPLSKAYLAGQMSPEQMLIKNAAAYEKAGVRLRLGVRALRIDRAQQQVRLSTGEVLDYSALALTLGARVRELSAPGAQLPGVFHLRTIADLDRIKAHAAAGGCRRAVIVGGGYIGLETAAGLRHLGLSVSLLEAMPRLLQRVTSAEVSDFYHRVHTEEGVDIRCDKSVQRILGETAVTAVQCEDGETLPADLVIVGIGVLPNLELADAAGLVVGHGIRVNAFAQTSDPQIVAAGDCTEFFSEAHGRLLRLESVPHAMAQASCAAATLCGKPVPYQAQPWFWSDQYDLKLQMAGLSQGHEQAVVRGDSRQGRSFSVFYLAGGRVLAVDCVNRPKDFMLGKKLMAASAEVSPDALADESQELGRWLSTTETHTP